MTPLLVDLASWWLQAGLLLGAGLVLPVLVRLRDPGMRLRLGQLLLAIAILLPLLQPRGASQADGVPGTGPVFSLAILVTGRPPVAAASVETVVLVLLAAGAGLRLAWLGAGLLRLRSLRRRSRPLSPLPPPIASAMARTAATAEILVSPEIASPVTLGWLRPAILLPESFALLEGAEQEAVACHELLHVKRRDSWALLLEECARALLWAQPAAWGVLSGISLSREQAVDRAAIDSTGDLRAYLRALAVLARLSQESPAAALPFHTRSHLVRRVAHLAKEVPMSRTRATLATAVAAAALLVVGAAGAAAFPFGADSQPPAAKTAPAKASVAVDESDVLKVGGDVKEPVQISRSQPTYPEEARKNGIQGIVKLSAVIDAKGTVTKVEPIESPDPTLAAAAVDAVRKWTYKPATLKGKPVKVIMTITVSFKLA
ncbi:MAG: M56 family metallopeptidase [Holophagales bacterium]|nr:M56 family metallopeptidase [Holophagales bacterium]